MICWIRAVDTGPSSCSCFRTPRDWNGRYLIFFECSNETVQIIRILHAYGFMSLIFVWYLKGMQETWATF
ncbi:MAG: hypothetical protein H0X11_02160 [Betaproteobacteria bacterium]|nr:hypothetical protein [Betaproteobacteria bacterium]